MNRNPDIVNTNPDTGQKSGHLLIKIVFTSRNFLFVGNVAPKCFSSFLGESTKYPENLIKFGGLVFEKNGNMIQRDIHLLLLG